MSANIKHKSSIIKICCYMKSGLQEPLLAEHYKYKDKLSTVWAKNGTIELIYF